jgi:hypothetical protein
MTPFSPCTPTEGGIMRGFLTLSLVLCLVVLSGGTAGADGAQ